MKLAFIGGGAMGEAMIRAMLAEGLASPPDIVACDILPKRLEALSAAHGITVSDDPRTAVEGRNVVVLAVKPQSLAELMASLKGGIGQGQFILSIIAGAKMSTIAQGLGHSCIVRAMPNTPAQVGQGMSVWTASAEVGQGQKDASRSILGALGREVYVSDEDYIDMATAVSGSGPAYFFLFIEALTQAAADIGLPPQMAAELALETALGAARLARESGESPQALRERVTSPGGTTEAGLAKLEEGKVREALARAVAAAYERAKELGA